MPVPKKKTPKRKKTALSSLPPVGMVRVDKARAAKEGNRYHEAWLTRRSLELIFPRDGLAAIAVEGLYDEVGLSQEAIEIADATFYFGSSNYDQANALQIEQFKFSISRDKDPFRASDANKTLTKFAKTDNDMVAKHGQHSVLAKVRYGITTNRPIYQPLVEAIEATANGSTPKTAAAKKQLAQIKKATGFNAFLLSAFCKRLQLAGYGDTVASIDGNTRRTIADWSASTDLQTKARIGSLRHLISAKAGIPGQDNKTIFKEDVLAAFDVSSEKDLLPTPQVFPEIGEIVERKQLSDFLSKLEQHQLILIHATGGIGKTVFALSAAKKLASQDEVVVFDCFGGGAYRIPTDGRHRPERGLMHIVNELAARGLCDPILPGATDPDEIIRTAIQRFKQAIEVLKRSRPNSRLVIVLDAVDNSGIQANDLSQPSFPRLLFKTFSFTGVPDGLVLIGTCRPERTHEGIGKTVCFQYSLERFSLQETTDFVKARRPEATSDQIASIQHRSAANPRIIASLIKPSRSLSSEDMGVADLDSLIREQIDIAVKDAQLRGAEEAAINAFLCALARLPPPVPIDELAAAFGQPIATIESFASDLAPLLDRTRHGLIFRDEPTETLVRMQFGVMTHLLADVVSKLTAAQDTSAYAARSLPGLLFAIGDISSLQSLAFDNRFPPALTSEVAKRSIRMNRLQVAVAAAAHMNDADAMTALMVELSSVAIVHERGDDYFLQNPDLVMALGDAEATRRLYESRRGWFGARPSRLTIAYILEGELGEAYEEARQSAKWLQWLYSKHEDDPRNINPSINDYAAWSLYLLEAENHGLMAKFLDWWAPEHSFKVAMRILELDQLARNLDKAKFKANADLRFAMRADCPTSYLAAFLVQRPSVLKTHKKKIIAKLARGRKNAKKIDKNFGYQNRSYTYWEGILGAALAAFSCGMRSDAKALRDTIIVRRYHFYQIQERVVPNDLSSEILTIALDAALKNKSPTVFDCLPNELAVLVENIACPPSVEDQEKAILAAINEAAKQDPDPKVKPRVSPSDRREWTDRLHATITPVRMIATAVYELLQARPHKNLEKAVKSYFDTWENARVFGRKQNYGSDRDLGGIDQNFLNTFFHLMVGLGLKDSSSATFLLARLKDVKFKPSHLLTLLVGRLALNVAMQETAGALAADIISIIEATQDIAIDAYRRELLPDAELGLGNSFFVNAYRVAGLIPGGVSLIIADSVSWPLVFLITATFMVPGILCSVLIKEPILNANPPRTLREAIIEPFHEFFTRTDFRFGLLILAFLLLYKFGDSLATAQLTPFYIDMGFTNTQIGTVAKLIGFWSMIAGAFLGGLIMVKIGINRALWLFGSLQFFSILGFALLSMVEMNVYYLGLAVGFEYLGVGLGATAFVAFIATQTNKKFSATQFALFSIIFALPRSITGLIAGLIVEKMGLGWTKFFLISAVTALPGMILLYWVAPWNRQKTHPTDSSYDLVQGTPLK